MECLTLIFIYIYIIFLFVCGSWLVWLLFCLFCLKQNTNNEVVVFWNAVLRFWGCSTTWEVGFGWFQFEIMTPKNSRNLQQDPRFTDPEKTWVSIIALSRNLLYLTGSVGIRSQQQFLMDGWVLGDDYTTQLYRNYKNRQYKDPVINQPGPGRWLIFDGTFTDPNLQDPNSIAWFHGNLRYPPQEIAGLIFRDYENPLVSLNKAGY